MKFDVIVANPPFNLGEKMLTKWFDLADTICTVQPSTWLLGKKKTKSICSHLDNGEFNADIESINGSEFFNAGISGVMAIQYFDKNSTKYNDCYVKFDGKEYTKTDDISSYSNDPLISEFKNIVSPLFKSDNLQKHIKSIPNVHVFGNAPEEHNPDDNWYVFRITRFSVHPDGKHTNWCITSKNMLQIHKFGEVKDKVEKNGNQYLKYYIPFTNKIEANNVINYIQTDFCRTCLYLVQTSYELGRGECNFIPWFDFSNPVFSKSPSEIDDYLFTKYNISNEIRKHIESLLPDYYSIRNKEGYIKFDGKQYTKTDDITLYSNDLLLAEFKNIIKQLCLSNNLEKNMRAIPDDNHLVKYWYKNQKDDEYVIKVGIVRGHKDKLTGKNKDDFYSIISNNMIEVNKSIGIFNDLYKQKNQFGKRLINFYIPTNSTNKNIAFNIVNYLKTDFCRAGLYLSKFNMNMYPNVFINIPWFDFSNPVFSKSPSEIDDYLFTKYNISNEIRKHIESLLPDYYNIRKG